MPKERVNLPALARIGRQVDELYWILRQSGWDPSRWKPKLSTYLDHDTKRVVLEVVFRHRELGKISLSSTDDPAWSESTGIGTHHYWIDGNHWYDEFAVSTLKSRFEEIGPTERLCRTIEAALGASGTGVIDGKRTREIREAIHLAREGLCPDE